MAQYTAYANYVIYFRSQTDYDNAILIAGGLQLLKGPRAATAMFGISFPYPSGPLDPVAGVYTLSYTLATPGANIGHPLPSGVTLDDTVDSVLIPGQAASFGGGVGPDLLLKWCCNFELVGGGAGSNPAPTANIPKRRWIDGFEAASVFDAGGSGTSARVTRTASRTCEGLGFALRNDLSVVRTHTLIQNGAVTDGARSWERFYIRIRTANPTASVTIWQSGSNSSAIEGGVLKVNTSGQIEAYNSNDIGTETLLGTSGVLTLETKYKIDVAISYSTKFDGTAGGQLRAWLNGVQFVDATIAAASGGLGQAGRTHERTNFGNNNGAANTYELDFDSWINAQIPVAIVGGAVDFTSIDFLAGSHVSKQWNDSINASTNWGTPVLESTNQGENPSQISANSRTQSTTSGARLNVRSNYSDTQDSIGARIGVVAAMVSLWSDNSGSTDGTLGYALALAAAVMATINQINTASINQVAYLPSGMNTPTAVAPIDVIHDKSADGNTDNTHAMQVFVENIGTFGPEDDPNSDFPSDTILHSAYYPNTLWSFVGPTPDAPVFAVGGTYTGNSTSQHIDLPAPAQFIWIRALAGGSGGVKWFGAGLGGHLGDTDGNVPGYITRAWVDSAGQAKFTVTGPNVENNLNATTYQYIAFCDPGMRWNICSAYKHASALASAINALTDTAFTPLAAFVQNEAVGVAGSSGALFYKGPGMAGNVGASMAGNSQANFGSFAAGQLTSRADIHGALAGANYSVWRTTEPGSSQVMVQILQYTGDGAASQVIPLTPASGRFPLFALVVPQNGTDAIMRDPSNAGTTSTVVRNIGSNAATGIIAGAVDQITVGSALNINLAVYSVFVIPGSTVSWANGTFYPSSAASPSSVYPPPSGTPPDIGIIGEGGLVLGGDASMLLVENMSGIYELVPGQHHDTIQTRAGVGTGDEDIEIPDPFAETGYIGG